ncbi:MAG TPA: hypothetical protein PL124_12450 [Candidatus Cloacimonadota bacterium]|nr:hypothetical protein [Candidatus Cloacimonadota bacterium]
MKYLFMTSLWMCVVVCVAFECSPFGPETGTLQCANLQMDPPSFGGIGESGYTTLYVFENDSWQQYPFWTQDLPAIAVCKRDDATLMMAMGAGTYSDGLYNFDRNSHAWTINEWFIFPNFVLHCNLNDAYFIGEQAGLFRSGNAIDWTWITDIGSGACNSFAASGTHMIVNRDSFVYHSADGGQTWSQADMSNLRGFRYTSAGTLYGIMDVGSDSDGLWRSDDYGATWMSVLYTTGLASIGPDFNGVLPLGWREPETPGHYLALLDQQFQLEWLNHADLNSPVKDMQIFPLVNTPSFYVLNTEGCYFLTGFMPVDVNDETASAPLATGIRLYPNPFMSEVKLELDKGSGAMVTEICNLKGQIVKTLTLREGITTWDGKDESGRNTAPGIYLCRYHDNQHHDQYRKLVKLD